MVWRNGNSRTSVFSVFVVVIACFGQVSVSFGQAPTSSAPSAAKSEDIANAKLTWQITRSLEGGYGYDVYADGKLLIHQPRIPGQPGIKGFRTKADSEKVVRLVVKKLRNKEIPPTVSQEELRDLEVID
jgi:hypothetical protein